MADVCFNHEGYGVYIRAPDFWVGRLDVKASLGFITGGHSILAEAFVWTCFPRKEGYLARVSLPVSASAACPPTSN